MPTLYFYLSQAALIASRIFGWLADWIGPRRDRGGIPGFTAAGMFTDLRTDRHQCHHDNRFQLTLGKSFKRWRGSEKFTGDSIQNLRLQHHLFTTKKLSFFVNISEA
uniref:(northern house mosquito) hypothetical protein n=1 Tax=Culex pipiens TaxID=7175 RepID=A0A8D8E1R2_CULPI